MKNLEKLAELAKTLPATLVENASTLVEKMGEVIEGFGDKDIEWRPGTLKLVQATTDRTKIPKGAGIGSLMLAEEVLEQPFKVIPLRIDVTRQYWNPDNTRAQMLCSSPDAKIGFMYGDCFKCPHSKFDEEANRSACNKSLSILCLSADLTNVFTVNFTKTNYVNGTDWQSSMKKLGVNTFNRFYNLSTEPSPKAKNVEIIKAAGVTGEKVEGAVLDFVKEMYNLAKVNRVESLDGFYKYIENKKSNSSLQLEHQATSDIALISDHSHEQEVLPPEAPFENSTPATGKKYKL